MSAAGDVNGDGVGDIIVGAPAAYGTQADAGATYIVFGSSVPGGLVDIDLAGPNALKINGEYSGNGAGASVANAGDVNGDTIDDFIIGDPDFDEGSGTTYVVFGTSVPGGLADLDLAAVDLDNAAGAPRASRFPAPPQVTKAATRSARPATSTATATATSSSAHRLSARTAVVPARAT